jgi:hypothetical protein
MPVWHGIYRFAKPGHLDAFVGGKLQVSGPVYEFGEWTASLGRGGAGQDTLVSSYARDFTGSISATGTTRSATKLSRSNLDGAGVEIVLPAP